MWSGRNRKAVIIGGSIGGLLAARWLSNQFDEIVVLDRDQLPHEPIFRAGAPQSRHAHILPERGRTAMEEAFPGLTDELVGLGAPLLDHCADLRFTVRQSTACRFPSNIPFLSVSRALLEHRIRCRVEILPNVDIRPGCTVSGPIFEHGEVVGVNLRGGGEIRADLVVDSTGRRSRAAEWLEQMGFGRPPEDVVDPFLGYATREFRRPPQRPGEPRAHIVVAPSEGLYRGAVAFPLEGDRWIVTLAGMNRDYPPTDAAGFSEFVASLGAEELVRLVEQCEPLGRVYGYRGVENRLRHFERLPSLPPGFVAISDAVAGFNPVYGQGMTMAAEGARLLGRTIATHDRRSMPKAFHARLAKLLRPAWLAATTDDFRFPETTGERPFGLSLVHKYLDMVVDSGCHDPVVRRTFVEVLGMTRPAYDLLRPSIVVRSLMPTLRRALGPHSHSPAENRRATGGVETPRVLRAG